MNKKVPETTASVIKKRIIYIRDSRYITRVVFQTFIFLISLYVIFNICFGITAMKSTDMMPRLSAGDLLFYYRLEKEYKTPDILVFTVDGQEYVGRVLGKPGDTIDFSDTYNLVLNGNQYIENDIFYKTFKYDDLVEYPVKLEDNEYFILCDYRDGAKDSRYFGKIHISQVKGKVITALRRNNL